LGRALQRADRETAQAAIAHQRQERGDVAKLHAYAPAQHIGRGRRDAAIGDMHDVDARHSLEQFAAEVLRRPNPGRCEGQFSRLLFRQGDELRNVVDRQRRGHGKDIHRVDHHRDRNEILGRIVRQFVDHGDIRCHGRVAAHQNRVAIRSRARGALSRGASAHTGDVFNNQRLAEGLAKRWADDPDDDIRQRTGGIGNHTDRLVGIFRLRHDAIQWRHHKEQRRDSNSCLHEFPRKHDPGSQD
jgi:hypothetical protein